MALRAPIGAALRMLILSNLVTRCRSYVPVAIGAVEGAPLGVADIFASP
jgi:hypothetical protein